MKNIKKLYSHHLFKKKNWKPSFEWEQEDLVSKAVPKEDVCAIDLSNQLIPSSTSAIQLDFALQFGLIKDDKNNQYHLGPNLEYELPQVSYTSFSVPTKTNTIYPWLGDHYLGSTLKI